MQLADRLYTYIYIYDYLYRYIQNIRSHTNDLDLDGGVSSPSLASCSSLIAFLDSLSKSLPRNVIGKYMGLSENRVYSQ